MDNILDEEFDIDDILNQDIFDDINTELKIELMDEEFSSDDYILSSGQALNENELYQLTARTKTRIIYVLGPVGSGKTTFESMLYAFFLKNIDQNFLFAGSETLVGFEERLNNLRTKSGNSNAQMERTNKSELRCFLHLNLLDLNLNCYHNIVFSDMSGETFENCNSNRSNMEQDLPYLDIAQNVVLFMDGETLLDKSERHGSVMKIKSFLKTFKSSKLYNKKTNIDIIISKNDIIYEKTRQERNDFIDHIEKQFDAFVEDFNINFYRIEAINGTSIKDDEKSVKLIDLLKCWISNSSDEINDSDYSKKSKMIHNDFNRFGERY